MTDIDAIVLQQLIDAHAAAMTLYARQWCRSPEDAVQEAFIELIRQDPPPQNTLAWLYTTVRRRAMNFARAEDRRAKHHHRASQLSTTWFVPTEDSFGEAIDYQELLGQLPRLEREIVVARIWGELSFAQIAELVQHPLSTIHRRYQRALAELERLLKELDTPSPNDESKPTLH